MSDPRIHPGTPGSSGGRANLAGSVVLFLFGLPFAGFGSVAIFKGLQQFFADGGWDKLGLAAMGLLFFAIGGLVMAGAIWGRKLGKRATQKQMQFPDQPWMWRDDWAAGKIKSTAMAQFGAFMVMGLIFCAVGVVPAFLITKELPKGNYAALIALVFPLVGILLLAAWFNSWRSRRRFGECFFEPAGVPIPIGGTLAGIIQVEKPLRLERELSLKITCLRRVVTGAGDDRNTQEIPLWQNEKVYSAQADLSSADPGHGTIPVRFQLPNDQPEVYSQGGESVIWRLEARSKMQGPGFHAVFDLPVYRVVGTEVAASAPASDPDPTAPLEASIDEIRRDEGSRIRITDCPDGREFHFPAARNPGAAAVLTLFFLIWSAFFWFMLVKHAPVIFPIFWGVSDVFVAIGCFNLWFKSSRVTINPVSVRATSRYLLFSRTRRFATSEVEQFATTPGMRSGSQVYTNIKLIKTGSSNGTTVASGIASVAEANWLIAEMNKALGRAEAVRV